MRRQPRLAPAWNTLAAACQALGLWTEAEQALRRVADLDPGAVEARFALAQMQVTLGRTRTALGQLRRLADEPGQRLRALAAIGELRPERLDPAEADAMAAACRTEATPAPLRVALWFALGKWQEGRGSFEAAFAAFSEGNRLQRALLEAGPPERRPQNVLAEHASAGAHVRAVITAQALASSAGGGDASVEPIFIVGMPRSGSTLLEQILASHPDVVGLGETAILPSLLESIYPARAGEDFAEPLGAVARRYLDAVRERGWDGRRRFVDKTLENHLHVGVIRMMFPRAVILNSVRDPIDTCLGVWRQRFTRGSETFYDFADIAAEYAAHQRMIAHWRGLLADGVGDVALEDLVAEPERVTRWLVTQACGLPWTSACLRFWTTARGVRTASASQVRQPISAAGVGRWRRYEPWLGPLLDALKPVLDERPDAG